MNRKTDISLMHLSVGLLFLAFLLTSVVALAGNTTKLEGDIYRILIETRKVEKRNTVTVTISPKGNVHINLEYPWKIKVTESRNLSFEKQQIGKSDASVFTDSKVVFELPCKATASRGAATFELKMSMCNEKQCFMKKIPIEYKTP